MHIIMLYKSHFEVDITGLAPSHIRAPNQILPRGLTFKHSPYTVVLRALTMAKAVDAYQHTIHKHAMM